ncbi:MAG TPA: hypothetical protein VNU93_08265 [Verrucomicrobiae bacterium]|nr:hypothetical protein [Verrucomicrobiae bacterium]
MLKRLFAKAFVQVYRVLFTSIFIVLNVIGIVFLAVVGYYLIF